MNRLPIGLLRHIDTDIRVAVQKVIEAGVDATAWLGDFCEGFINAGLISALGQPERWTTEALAVPAGNFDDARIPWSTEP